MHAASTVVLRPLAPDKQTAALVDDFLAAQLAPRTRATYATDLALYLGWLQRRGSHPLASVGVVLQWIATYCE